MIPSFSLAAIPQVLDLDLAFAISANAPLNSEENFGKLKDIMDWVVNKHGVGKIQYAVVVFGDTPDVKISFAQPINDEQLRLIIHNSTVNKPGSNVVQALVTVKDLFKFSPRPEAKRVLVLVTDKGSGGTIDDIRNSAKDLWLSGIKVIPVAFGRDADPDEIKVTSSEEKNLIDVPDTNNPDAVAEEIMQKCLEGKELSTAKECARIWVMTLLRRCASFQLRTYRAFSLT